MAAKVRYETRSRIAQAQAASLAPAAIEAAIPGVVQQLVAAKPAAVEKPEQVVPGTPTAAKLGAQPAAPAPTKP